MQKQREFGNILIKKKTLSKNKIPKYKNCFVRYIINDININICIYYYFYYYYILIKHFNKQSLTSENNTLINYLTF